MKMKVVFALATIVFLLGCFTQPGPVVVHNKTTKDNDTTNQTPPATINTSKGCEVFSDQQLRDNCHMNRITGGYSQDIGVCEKIDDPTLRDKCTHFLALKDVSLCEKISSLSMDLRDDCYYSHADSIGDETLCMKIEGEALKTECQNKRIDEKCSGLDDYEQTICYATEKNAPEICEQTNQTNKCYIEIAKKTKNLEICELITSAASNKACAGIVTGNYEVCKELEYNTTEDTCYQKIAIELNNYSICENTVTETYINECYETLALMNNFPSLCKKLVKEPQRDMCYYNVGVRFNDVDVCSLVLESGKRDLCRVAVAKSLGEPYICGVVENNYFRNYQCFPTIMSGDYEISLESCEKINAEHMSWRDECFLKVSEDTGNSTICDYIQTESIKSRCS